jgi:hypothetical protein
LTGTDGRGVTAPWRRHGAAMQPCMNDVLSAPTSFLALASLRHAVRLACFAAASAEGVAAGAAAVGFAAAGAGVAAAGVPGVSALCADGVAANPPATAYSHRHTAGQVLKAVRIALTVGRTDEARMKLA